MDQSVGAAARLPGSNRKDLAIQALAQSATISDLAARHGVSRKFVYQQTHKARSALDDAFLSATLDDEVLFEAVTQAAKCRALWNTPMSATVAAIRDEVIGPMPGIVAKRRAVSSCRAWATISASNASVLSSSARH